MKIKEIALETNIKRDGILISIKWRKWLRYSLSLIYITLFLVIYFVFIKDNFSFKNTRDILYKSKFVILMGVFAITMYLLIKNSFDTYAYTFMILTISILSIIVSIGLIFLIKSEEITKTIDLKKLIPLIILPSSISIITKLFSLLLEYRSSNEVAKIISFSLARKILWWLIVLLSILSAEYLFWKYSIDSIEMKWTLSMLSLLVLSYIVLLIFSIAILGFKKAISIIPTRIAIFAVNIIIIIPTAIWHFAIISKKFNIGEYVYLGLFVLLSIILISITIFEKTTMKSPIIFLSFSTLLLILIWASKTVIETEWQETNINLLSSLALLYTALFVTAIYVKVDIDFKKTIQISFISFMATVGTIVMWLLPLVLHTKNGKTPELFGITIDDFIYSLILSMPTILFLESIWQWFKLQRKSRKMQKKELKEAKGV